LLLGINNIWTPAGESVIKYSIIKPPDDKIIHDNEKILVFYDSIIDLLSLKENESQLATIQFLYAGRGNEF